MIFSKKSWTLFWIVTVLIADFKVGLCADPYLNIDAGTMSPIEHGEVYVLDDGGEVYTHFSPNCSVSFERKCY